MYKLAAFTVAMVLLPIGTYFLSRDYVFSRASPSSSSPTCAAPHPVSLSLADADTPPAPRQPKPRSRIRPSRP